MIRVLGIVAAVTATSEFAYAQAAGESGTRRAAHLFVSNGVKLQRLGGARSVLHVGVGMDWRHQTGLGVGVEAGPRFEDHALTRLDDVMLDVNVSYHARSGSSAGTVVPFVVGGVSLGWEPVPDGQQTSFFSVGGGVTYWLSGGRGLRFEVRDAVTLDRPHTGYHYLGVRVGYTWLMGGR